jgi:ribonucleoside-diphosphate reductase beta chain
LKATNGDWHGDSGVWSNFEQMMQRRKAAGAAN